jgi:hypothetical protein
MANSGTMKQVLAVFITIVLGLALTPSVGSFTTDAGYTQTTEYKEIQPLVANSTTLTYDARNDSTTYAYFTISLNDTTADTGLTTLDEANNMTYTESTKTVTFTSGVLDDGKVYNATISYYTEDLTNDVVLVLLPIAPILWIVAVIAVGIVAITVILRKS